jgi:hypothetical protein
MADDTITIERDDITLTIEAPDVDTAAVARHLTPTARLPT